MVQPTHKHRAAALKDSRARFRAVLAATQAVLLIVGLLLATAAAASAQESASSFEELVGRIQIGHQIWVTDTTGRQVRGRLERLSSDRLVLEANGLEVFAAPDVRQVRARDRDSLKNGTLIGLGIGLGLGTAWCIGAVADDSGEIDARVECAEGFTVFPGFGALIGLAVDAVIPGKMRVVYQAPLSREASRAYLTVVPLVSSRAKGVALSFVF
jgi:hypothetical protein